VRFYPGAIPGRVTGLSVSPDGRKAVLALAPGESGETEGRVELLSYRFRQGPPAAWRYFPRGSSPGLAPVDLPRHPLRRRGSVEVARNRTTSSSTGCRGARRALSASGR
jgi:hypothetical protein